MIQMQTALPLPTAPAGAATTPLPIPGKVIDRLGLWQRNPAPTSAQPAASAGMLW
jgi:hypothetical protein